MRLNVGCGEHHADGWTNTDLHRNGPRPDVVCSIFAMPFPDGAADRVYCGHVLEHIALENVRWALEEIDRVLTTDGLLMVVGPDVHLTAEHEPILMDGVLRGGRRWPGDEHRWEATGDATLHLLRAAGFAARLFPVGEVSDEWPIVDRAPWQFAITARHRVDAEEAA